MVKNQTATQLFNFKPVTRDQQTLIHTWLKQDYINEWIHGKGLANTLTGLSAFIEYYEKTQCIDRQSALTQHWVGYNNETPFVYLLTFNVLGKEESIYSQHKSNDGLAITLDIFIGEKTYLGKGLATEIIKQFLSDHFSDVSEIFIDPEKNNTRAIHVYQKAGFEIIDEFIAPWRPVPHYLMKLNMR